MATAITLRRPRKRPRNLSARNLRSKEVTARDGYSPREGNSPKPVLNRPLRANLFLDIGDPRRHAEFPAAHLGEHGDALADVLVRRTGEAQPQPAAGVGLVGGPFRSRVDRDAGGKRGLIKFQRIDI